MRLMLQSQPVLCCKLSILLSVAWVVIHLCSSMMPGAVRYMDSMEVGALHKQPPLSDIMNWAIRRCRNLGCTRLQCQVARAVGAQRHSVLVVWALRKRLLQ